MYLPSVPLVACTSSMTCRRLKETDRRWQPHGANARLALQSGSSIQEQSFSRTQQIAASTAVRQIGINHGPQNLAFSSR